VRRGNPEPAHLPIARRQPAKDLGSTMVGAVE